MKGKKLLIPFVIVALAVLVVAGVVSPGVSFEGRDTTLAFRIQDAVSKSWVWDARVTLQDREIRSYYQSDRGPVLQQFTHLEPGEWQLTLEAPNYVSRSIPVSLSRGENTLSEPIELIGYQIPGLARFLAFEEAGETSLEIELRPLDKHGEAITNHPCLDLWIGARVAVQLKDGVPAQGPTETGARRGRVLYSDKVPWRWITEVEESFRYRAFIPLEDIAPSDGSVWVIDYLIAVPDHRRITPQEFHALMDSLFLQGEEGITDPRRLQEDDRFSVYLRTSWNVRGRQG